jgi:Rhs element Vgr protein
MPDSPLLNSSKVVDLKVSANGSQIEESIRIASISISAAVNKIPYARIELFDGDMPDQDFPISNTADFAPGSEIKIEAGYGQKLATIFEGIIVKHGIKISGDNDSRLIIECRNKAVKLTVGRRNANYVKQKDSEVLQALIDKQGLKNNVDATSFEYEELVQYYCSDWDFLLSRAEINGLLVIADGDTVSVKKPDTSTAAELQLTYGDDLIELHADMDARSQYAKVSSVSWDPVKQETLKEEVAPAKLNDQGDLTSQKLSDVLGLDSFRIQTQSRLEQPALKAWADGQQVKSGLARIRGRMKFQGSAVAKPGTLIELAGVGAHFNGSVFVSAVNHQISQGNWITEAVFGMAPDWFAEQRDLVAPPAAGLLPGVDGLQIGVVDKLDEDPAGEPRIKVKLPVLEAEAPGVWARLANFYASDGFGAFFIPEIGDEVLLGYLNSDPNNPVVLGSLYSSKRKPPYDLSADNFTKAIVTQSKLKLEFDDDKKIISLITPGDNQVIISDDGKSILLQDQSGNKVELNDGGIVLDSPKDISITAKGKIILDATGEICVSSQADVSASGMNVNLEAQTGLTAKGNATAELSASGQTTVKGAVVMIN